jgi:hypothetical protein
MSCCSAKNVNRTGGRCSAGIWTATKSTPSALTISGHSTRSVFDRYNIVDETDLAEATRKIEARNQPSISADETHTELKHASVRVS